jgi:hypothetical protein
MAQKSIFLSTRRRAAYGMSALKLRWLLYRTPDVSRSDPFKHAGDDAFREHLRKPYRFPCVFQDALSEMLADCKNQLPEDVYSYFSTDACGTWPKPLSYRVEQWMHDCISLWTRESHSRADYIERLRVMQHERNRCCAIIFARTL